MIRPSDAEKMGVHKGDVLKVTVKDKSHQRARLDYPESSARFRGRLLRLRAYGVRPGGQQNRLQRVRNSGRHHAVSLRPAR